MRPDAFGVLKRGGKAWPFFLEWERRAVRPVAMTAPIAHLRYFATRRPLDDHGVTPLVLVVFEDGLAATHFLKVAGEEMTRAGVRVPLWVSHRDALEQVGTLGAGWHSPGRWEPGRAFG